MLRNALGIHMHLSMYVFLVLRLLEWHGSDDAQKMVTQYITHISMASGIQTTLGRHTALVRLSS